MDILVSVGVSEFGFERLFRIIDELCEEGVLDGNHIIAQKGVTSYTPKHYRSFDLIGRDEYQKYMEQADAIISHAGTGSVIPALKIGKKVIVFPRLEKYGEHVDNHQLELADVFTHAGYTLCATNKEELKACIHALDSFTPPFFQSNTTNMNCLIIDFIDNGQMHI